MATSSPEVVMKLLALKSVVLRDASGLIGEEACRLLEFVRGAIDSTYAIATVPLFPIFSICHHVIGHPWSFFNAD